MHVLGEWVCGCVWMWSGWIQLCAHQVNKKQMNKEARVMTFSLKVLGLVCALRCTASMIAVVNEYRAGQQ